MRRAILLLLAATAALVVAAGVVGAADSTCDGGACVGTREADTITGSSAPNRDDPLSGADLIAGLEGNDTINSGTGRDVVYADEGDDAVTDNSSDDKVPDVVYGDEGNDTINVLSPGPGGPGEGDEVRCGPGKRDKVFYDRGLDAVARDCEIKRPG